jgi:predicted transcriptional regulator
MAGNSKDRNDGRTGKIWQLYAVHGWTQERIAAELDVSQSLISKTIKLVRDNIPQQTRAEIVTERIEQLRAVVNVVAPYALVGDKDAVASILKLQERESKLLGLDAATKVEHSGKIATYDITGVNMDDLA